MKQLIVIIITVLCCGVSFATEIELISADELVPGEPGLCRTEMDGGEMVEIELTILGVLGASTPEGEMVLVRLHGERFEHTGIIAGMSGSPVYVRDRLLGALAFGWAFSKDPIGGVTPFARMQNLEVEEGAAGPVTAGRLDLAAIITAAKEGRVGPLLVDSLLPERVERETIRIPMPIAVSGAQFELANGWLAEAWRRLGWVSTVGGTVSFPEDPGPLKPGGAISAVLVDGDAGLAAGGTVTEVRGDQVWAFGHPFLGAGNIELPMARGHVVAVLPSANSSFKFINAGEAVGTLKADRAHGVWGTMGEVPSMLPVVIRVDDREYHFRTVRDPVLLPFLAAHLANTSYSARGKVFGEQQVKIDMALVYSQERVDLEEYFSGVSAAAEAAGYLGAVLSYFEGSSFAKSPIETLEIVMKTSEKVDRAVLVDAVADRVSFRPGENVELRIRMRPHRGEEFVQTIVIKIPEGLSDGRFDLIVADGASWTAYDLQMRPPRPASFADEVQFVNQIRPSSEIVVALERRDLGVTIPGGTVAAPPSIVVNLRSGLGPNLRTWSHRVIDIVEREMDMPVSGAQRISLRVKRETRP